MASERTASPATTTASGTKRKRDNGPKFYSVRAGHAPGIYHSWADCLEQVTGYKKAIFKSFPSLTEAEAFLHDNPSHPSSATKFYAVQSGRLPGVYTDWPSAQQQIVGWSKPKHKSFASRAEAEAFVREGAGNGQAEATQRNNGQTAAVTQSLNSGDAEGTETPAAASSPGTVRIQRPAPTQTEPIPPPPKKQKIKNVPSLNTPEPPPTIDETVSPGTGPLPPGSEDGFDPRIVLNPTTGAINYKTPAQQRATKPHATRPSPSSMLRIYTDGSALANGTASATAGVGVYFGPLDPRNISEPLPGPRQTNQRAELTALLRAVDIAPRDRHVTIFSDSNYAINCVTVWVVGWRRNGWMTSGRKPVENRDLVEGVVGRVEEREGLGVRTWFEWVRGHGGDGGNVAADGLAVRGAREARASGNGNGGEANSVT